MNEQEGQYGPPVYLPEVVTKESLIIIQEKVAGLSAMALARFVTRARRAAGVRGVVSVLITNNRELQGLNRRFRGKNKPTDVLSFPPLPGLMKDFAGDVAISAEIAAQNARRLGHSVGEEISILVLHGLLHLAGYDHERDHGEMEGREAGLRRSLKLPVGLLERSGRAAAGKTRRAGTSRKPVGSMRPKAARTSRKQASR